MRNINPIDKALIVWGSILTGCLIFWTVAVRTLVGAL